MSIGRMRLGEWLALAGSAGLLVVLFLHWFDAGAGSTSGWPALGWFMDALLCLAIAGGLSITYMTLRRASPAWPVGASMLTSAVGAIVFLVLVVRVLTLGDNGGPGAQVTVSLPAYLGLLFAALIPVGAWTALRDERLDAPESAYTPPPARPVPGT